jgi:orotidine-5'-phosphate decarboxylase
MADAKRGDIGILYLIILKAFFEDLNFDSVTVAPYMGKKIQLNLSWLF